MNMKKLMMFVALFGIQYSVLYTMEGPEEPENLAQKEKETEEGGRGIKRKVEPGECPAKVLPWQPPKKRVKTVKSLESLASAKLLPYALQQENFPEILESISGAKETLKLEAEGYFPTETMLHNARGALEVRNLIELGLNPNQFNNKGQTAINALIDRGNLEGAYYLLKRFGDALDLTTPDELGFDPLQNAIRQKDSYLANTIITFLKKQNKIQVVMQRANKLGDCVLGLAIKEGLFELIPRIGRYDQADLQKIYERVMKDAYGALEIPSLQIALFLIVISGVRNIVPIQDLLQRGADINALYFTSSSLGNELLTLLMMASLAPKFITGLQMLLDNKVSVNFKNKRGRSALMFAIIYKNMEAIKLLLQAGADVNVQDDAGFTPLMNAAAYFPASIPLLLENGAGLENKNVNGQTALMIAIQQKNSEAVELLLEAGANANARVKGDITTLILAVRFFPDSIPLLAKHGARLEDTDEGGLSALVSAILIKNKEAVELLLEAGANVSARDKDSATPLVWAVRFFPDSIPLLAKHRARLEDTDEMGLSALVSAILIKNKEAVGLLLEAGSNVNASSLEVAKKMSSPEIIALLEAKLKEISQAKQEEEEGD